VGKEYKNTDERRS